MLDIGRCITAGRLKQIVAGGHSAEGRLVLGIRMGEGEFAVVLIL